MKTLLKCTMIMVLVIFSLQAQSQKNKIRLSVDFINIVGVEKYLEVNAKFKGEDGYEPGKNVSLNIYLQVNEDSLVSKGIAITGEDGMAKYILSDIPSNSDSLIQHIYVVKVEGNADFKDAEKKSKFFDSNIKAEIIDDSVSFVSAVFMDGLGDPIKKKKLDVNVHRLFAPLTIGESPYKTDGKGTILVSMADSLPGIDGMLTIEVSHSSKKYGTVKYIFDAPIGKVVVDESTFDQRTMWSPPEKTPIFLLVFSGLLIIGVWSVILILMRNLIKIYKS